MPHIRQTSELFPPTLPGINAAGIGRNSAARLCAQIPVQPLMEAGDLLLLFWGQRFVSAHTLQAREVKDAIDMRIPASYLHNGIHRLHYRLLKPGKRPLRSPEQQVQVKLDCPGGNGADEYLQPLQLPRQLRREGLCLAALSDAVPCTLAPYRNMAEGDRITVRWGDLRLDLPALKQSQVGNPVQAQIPLALICEAGPDRHMELSYCILDRVGNRSHWAPTTQLQVFAECPPSTSIYIPKM
ncbi:hypothetical protein [Pseudomonas sp. GZD-222]|uniref:hypothetical protein n=1 Tax=Pseudomonas sp. GZD-222 TaxID=3404805 RepID=UPI003BB4EA84